MIVPLVLLLAAPDEAPARRLPRVTTVCRTPGTTACWTEAGEARCTPGEPYRVVIDEPGRDDVAAALAECRRPPTAPRSQ